MGEALDIAERPPDRRDQDAGDVLGTELVEEKIKTSEEIARVGTILANGEKLIGDKIAEAMQKVGHCAASRSRQ